MAEKTHIFSHKKTLLDISKKLKDIDRQRLMFLCRDHIAHKDLDNIKTGIDLFEALEKGLHIKKDSDVSLLLEILFAVGRKDLSNELAEKMKTNKFNGETEKYISKFRYVLLDIAMTLSDQEVEEMKFMASDVLQCGKDNLEDIFKLLTELEKERCISTSDVRCLHELISHEQLKKKITEYEEAVKAELQRHDQAVKSAVDGIDVIGSEETYQRPKGKEPKETVLEASVTHGLRTLDIETAGPQPKHANISSDRQAFVLSYILHSNLSKLLNREHPLGNDWWSLGGELGLTAEDIFDLQKKENPTKEILEIWREHGRSLEDLKTVLEAMGRLDCVDKIQEDEQRSLSETKACTVSDNEPVITQPTDDPSQSGTSSGPSGPQQESMPRSTAPTYNETHDVLLVHSEHDVETNLFKDVLSCFKDLNLKMISMHEMPLGGDTFSAFYRMLESCTYTMCIVTSNFMSEVWCLQYVVQACEKAVREQDTIILYVKDKGFKDADIPHGLKGVSGAEYGGWAFKSALKNTFRTYLNERAEASEHMYEMNAVPKGTCLIINNMDFADAKLVCDRDQAIVDSEHMYEMNAVPKGTCLIINNMDFADAKLVCDRDQAIVDSENLGSMFTKLGFSVTYMTNLSSNQMKECFRKHGQEDHNSSNVFVCCIFSHGKYSELAGCDGKYLTMQSILDTFSEKQCPSLAGKPKIFFIQEHALHVDVPVEQQSSDIGSIPPQSGISEHRDFLISRATVHRKSHHNPNLGSWFINGLVDGLQKGHAKEDLIDLLIGINYPSGKRHSQPAFYASTLRKRVVLNAATENTSELEAVILQGQEDLKAYQEALKEGLTRGIPAEILVRGPKALKAYQEALKEGERPVFRTRLMLVGQERVGKTSLKKSLTGQSFNASEEITDGVDATTFVKTSKDPKDTWMEQDTASRDLVKHLESQHEDAVCAHMVKELKRKPDAPDNEEHDKDQKQEDIAHTDQTETSVADFLSHSKAKEMTKPVKTTSQQSIDPEGASSRTEESNDEDQNDESRTEAQAQPSEAILEAVVQQLQMDPDESTDDKGDPEFQIWDFAGQDVYYTTHQVFLSHRAIYVLVFDLSLDLNKQIPDIDQESSFHELTGLEFLDFWMQSIYAYASPRKIVDENDANKVEPQQPPTIFIVGTHRDSLAPNERKRLISEKFNSIKEMIKDRPYEKQVFNVMRHQFAVENSSNKQDDEDLAFLRHAIVSIARDQTYMGEKMPIKWLKFEKALAEEIKNGNHFMELGKVQDMCKKLDIEENKLLLMLQLYHDLGTIIYFGGDENTNEDLHNIVILDPQWLIDIFKRIITVLPYQNRSPKVMAEWRKLDNEGILEDRLIDCMWSDYLPKKKALLDLMKMFDLICPQAGEGEAATAYYVPACLKPCSTKIPPELDNICTFYIDFNGFLPDGLFHRLLVHAARWSLKNSKMKPQLKYRYGKFYLDVHQFQLRMQCAEQVCVKVTVGRIPARGVKRSAPDTKACVSVRRFLTDTLENLKNTWIHGITFGLYISCPCSDDTEGSNLHLLPLDQCLEDVELAMCNEKKEMVNIDFCKEWFQAQTQEDLVIKDSSKDTKGDDTAYAGPSGSPENYEVIALKLMELGDNLEDSHLHSIIRDTLKQQQASGAQTFAHVMKWIQVLQNRSLRLYNVFMEALEDQRLDLYKRVKNTLQEGIQEDLDIKDSSKDSSKDSKQDDVVDAGLASPTDENEDYEILDQISKSIGPDGGALELHDGIAKLEIPRGALDKVQKIKLSIISPEKDHPPLGDNFIIGPIVSLEPCGLQFLKPMCMTLTVKHAAVDLVPCDLEVWRKSKEKNANWELFYNGDGTGSSANTRLTEMVVQIRCTHFCWWCHVGKRCQLGLKILPFIPKDLQESKTVELTVYALKSYDDIERVQGRLDKKGLKPCHRTMEQKISVHYEQKGLKVEINNITDKDDDFDAWDVDKKERDTAETQLSDLKVDYKNLTGKDYEQYAPPAVQKQASSSGNTSDAPDLYAKVCMQQEKVRRLKSSIASKDEIDAAVKELLMLKADYAKELRDKVTAQEHKVRSLKESKASKDKIDAATKELQMLKQSCAAEVHAQVTSQEGKVRSIKSSKPSKIISKEKINTCSQNAFACFELTSRDKNVTSVRGVLDIKHEPEDSKQIAVRIKHDSTGQADAAKNLAGDQPTEIINMTFDLNAGKIETTPECLLDLTQTNDSSTDQQATWGKRKTFTTSKTFEWHWNNKFEIGALATLQFETGVPFIADGRISTTFSAKNYFSIGQDRGSSNTQTDECSIELPATVTANTKLNMQVIIQKQKLDVPFKAVLQKGNKRWDECGTFKGTESYKINVNHKESQL